MNRIQSPREMADHASKLRAAGKTVALVPLMGSVHAGKTALIRAAAAEGRAAVAILFANPFQVGPSDPAARYTEDREKDTQASAEAGAETVFAPDLASVFPRGYGTFVTEETISKRLCGISRPTHFRGVTTFSAYLINLIRPDSIWFGQISIQRAAVVRRMAEELACSVAVEVVPTLREADGLAASGANASMTATHRESALALSRALFKMKSMVAVGVTSPDRLVAEATHILSQQRRVRVIYVSVVDPATMEAVREVAPGRCLAAIAAWVDELRLVDNILL